MADNDKRVELTPGQATPGPWYVLEVMGNKFVAAKPTEDHPHFGYTSNIDIGGDEEYPRKDADLALEAASWEMGRLLLRAYGHWEMTDDTRAEVEAVLKKAGLLQ